MLEFWKGLSRLAQVGLAVVVSFFVLVIGLAAWWSFHADYQPLFTDLKQQDAAAMVAELDKQKIPYRLDEGGSTILVEQSQVHATRLKLMGKDIPLQGAVGFELFNNTDFGMTEFAQKINYQRALQGELTRTILSLAEVKDVRVHLAFPEQGLFKQAAGRAKAAITLTLKQGQSLRAEQVFGIQHLVAAATPGMLPTDVTVVNHQGVALSRHTGENEADGTASAGSSARLELKRETEDYLMRKAAAVLDRSFGAGQALASVDVVLNMDQSKTTTEDVIGTPAREGRSTGVVVRERESSHDSAQAPLDARGVNAPAASVQREVEYQVGRRVEQVVTQAGAIRRIQVVAVIRKTLDAAEEEQTRKLLAAAVGASLERGDTVVVQKIAGNFASLSAEETGVPQNDVVRASAKLPRPHFFMEPVNAIAGLILLLLLSILAFRSLTRGRASATANPLSEVEREALLRQIKLWMSQDEKPEAARP